LCSIVCCVFIVSSPSSLSVDPDTDDVPETETNAEAAGDTVEYDYLADDQIISTELPGKHSLPFDHPDIAYFYLLLALE
jgi:hypothetical protein